jgi:drug/metabolite transporter (DMT)-like permease
MTLIEKHAPLAFLVMWSSGAIFVKIGLEYASVSAFLLIRSAGAAMCLLIILLIISKRKQKPLFNLRSRNVISTAIFIGLVLQVGYQSAYFLALDYQLTPGVLAMILGLQPILTPLLGREKIGSKGFVFLMLGLAGLVVAVYGAKEVGAVTPLGLFFGISSVLAISIGSVMQKRARIDPLTSAFYQSLAAAVVFLAIMPATSIHLEITLPFILSALWMILIVSTLAVLLLFYMLSKDSASKVSVLFYMVPVLTVLLDYIVFGNSISWTTALGATLIILSIQGFNHTQRKPKH